MEEIIKMGKTLITGSDGLLGSQFNKNVIRLSHKDCDLRNSVEIDFLFRYLTNDKIQGDNKIDSIIHCAAKVGGVGGNMNHKGEFFYDNIMMNTNVIESAHRYGIKKLVTFLSTCVFPDNVEYPLTEKKIHLGPPHFTNDAYAYAKRMIDIQIRAYRQQFGLEYKSIIPTNIYGINDNFNLENGHLIPALIHKCFIARENGKPFMIWGSGKSLREFIYNKDVAKITEWVLDNYIEDEPIIVSTSNEVSIKEIVEIIIELMNFKGEVIFDTSKPEGQFRKPTDNSKMKSYLPDFKFTPLYDGLKETIEWFENNYEKIRK